MLPSVSQYSIAQRCAEVIAHILGDEMKLQSPERFLLTEHGQFTWMLAIMDDMNLGGSMEKYIHQSTLHRLSTALDGLPIFLSNHSGLRYAVLLSEKPRLPQSVDFPAEIGGRDIFPLGVGLAGAIHSRASQIVNMIIVGAQDSGKSMALRALAHTARLHGSDLYLADPVQHTFNPDVWGKVAVVENNTAGFMRMLDRLNDEIKRRSELFRSAAVGGIQAANIDTFNQETKQEMPRVWLIADEANTFLASKAAQEKLADPARIGRKYGVHIALAGHDWHEYTVNRGLTSYFETRLCLRTSNDTTGRIVLDDAMRGKRTMNFRQPGRGILRLRGRYREVQLYNVTPDQERAWFLQARPSDERMQWVAEQAEVRDDAPDVEPSPAYELDTAKVIAMSKAGKSATAIVRELAGMDGGRVYARLKRQVDEIIATATASKSQELQTFAPEMA